MSTKQAVKTIFSTVFGLLASGAAMAHTGVDGGSHHGAFLSGLLHPLTGTDHLVAMLAVGLWGALAFRPQNPEQVRQRVWQAPLTFITLLVVGALAGFAGFQPPGVEPMIAASLLALGLLIALSRGLAVVSMVTLVGLFAFFHGVAHGAELAEGQRWAALLGMVLTTATLHISGIGLGHALLQLRAKRRTVMQQAVGTGVAAMGVYALMHAF